MSQVTPSGQTEAILSSALKPVFPFFILKFQQGEEKDEIGEITMKVRPDIYNYIKAVYGRDDVVFYLDPTSSKMEAWSPSMHSSFEFTQRLNFMSSVRMWVQNARPHLAKIVAGVKLQ